MLEQIAIKSCLAGKIKSNSLVKVQGWVKTKRDSKAGLSFINLHDGSCFAPIQIVAMAELENYNAEILKISTGCSITVEGELVNSLGRGQSYEIKAHKIVVVGWVKNPESYPIQAKKHSLEFLRDVAHLRPRTNTISAVTRIRHRVAHEVHNFLDNEGFFWIQTPLITGSDCEGAGELFRVSTLDLLNLPRIENKQIDYSQDFFGKETFLTVSGQLNVEAYCLAMSKVYTFGPTFRAENSNTSRHLAEFWMIEPEIAFANLQDICHLSEKLLQHVCKAVLEKNSDDMAFFDKHILPGCIKRLEEFTTNEFAQITYSEAIKLLERSPEKFTYEVKWGLDLQSEHERYLAEKLFKKPLIVTDYPREIKSFYMRLNDDEKTVAAMDVLAPGIGEIIGGSQREERLEILEQRMQHMDCDTYSWYLDLRRYGSVPHAGFGLGFERLISYITGLNNVRDVISFPRTPGSANF